MTSGKIYIILIICICILACNNENEREGKPESNVSFAHRPSESIIALANNYSTYTVDTTCADLQVFVTSALKEHPDYNWPVYYYTKGDKEIEQQIEEYLAPELKDYKGELSLVLEYRTEVCNSIRLSLYDPNDMLIADITKEAQFYANSPMDWTEKVKNILVNSDKKLLGKIKLGTTIDEYLSYHPMIFAEAHFIFPNIKKEAFANGNHIKIEIELANDTTLTGIARTQE